MIIFVFQFILFGPFVLTTKSVRDWLFNFALKSERERERERKTTQHELRSLVLNGFELDVRKMLLSISNYLNFVTKER